MKKTDKPKDPYAVRSGERIRRCREAADMTQAELASAMGFKGDNTYNRIANYERGERRIGPAEAETLARVFPAYASAYFLGVADEQESAMLVLLRTQRLDKPRRAG